MKITYFNEPDSKFGKLDEIAITGSVTQLQGQISTIQIAIDRQQKQDHVHLKDYSPEWQDGDSDIIVIVENAN